MDNLNYEKYLEIRESRFEKIEHAENEKKRLEDEFSNIIKEKKATHYSVYDRKKIELKEAELLDEYYGYEEYVKIAQIEVKMAQLTMDGMDRKVDTKRFSYLIGQLQYTLKIVKNENLISYMERKNSINNLKLELLGMEVSRGLLNQEDASKQRQALLDDISCNMETIDECLIAITKTKIQKISFYLHTQNPDKLSRSEIDAYLNRLNKLSKFDEIDLAILDKLSQDEHIESSRKEKSKVTNMSSEELSSNLKSKMNDVANILYETYADSIGNLDDINYNKLEMSLVKLEELQDNINGATKNDDERNTLYEVFNHILIEKFLDGLSQRDLINVYNKIKIFIDIVIESSSSLQMSMIKCLRQFEKDVINKTKGENLDDNAKEMLDGAEKDLQILMEMDPLIFRKQDTSLEDEEMEVIDATLDYHRERRNYVGYASAEKTVNPKTYLYSVFRGQKLLSNIEMSKRYCYLRLIKGEITLEYYQNEVRQLENQKAVIIRRENVDFTPSYDATTEKYSESSNPEHRLEYDPNYTVFNNKNIKKRKN